LQAGKSIGKRTGQFQQKHQGKKKAETKVSALWKDLAATYSRGSYTTTTIGKAAFDGRVRDGNGSDHSFMATKSQNFKRAFWKRIPGIFTENYI
jgi:hypothetical protein